MFGVPPEHAIAAWEKRVLPDIPGKRDQARLAKGLPNPALPWKSSDVLWHGHSRGFFVARMTQADILKDVHTQVGRSIKEGRTFEQFRRELEPTLRTKGWWSGDEPNQKSLVRNPQTGEDEWTRLGTTRRLKTIYQTNHAVSYAAGNYEAMDELADLLPYQQYHTLDHGKNRRPSHQLLDGMVFAASDPALSSIRPPNGWGCQCHMVGITKRQALRAGPLPGHVQTTTKTMQVGRDGPQVQVTGVTVNGKTMFPDPQWGYDPVRHSQAVEDLAWNKIRTLPAPAQKSFVDSIARDPGLLEKRTQHWKAWTQGVESAVLPQQQSVAVGWMDKEIHEAVEAGLGNPTSPVVITTDKGFYHAIRDSKNPFQQLTLEQAQEIPQILSSPDIAYWDKDGLILYGPERPSLKGIPGRDTARTKLIFKRPPKVTKANPGRNLELTTAAEMELSEVGSNGVKIK